MDAVDYAAAVLQLTPAAVLAIGGTLHVRRPLHLATALAAGLPRLTVAPPALLVAARAWGVVELVVAATVTAGVLLDQRPAARVGSAAAATLFLLFAGWLARLLRTAPGAPCGCSDDAARASGWAVARALVLAAAAAAGAAITPAGGPAAPTAVALVGLSAAALAVLLWHLPAAVADPRPSPVTRPRAATNGSLP